MSNRAGARVMEPRNFGEIMLESAKFWKRKAMKAYALYQFPTAEISFRKALICEQAARQYFANVDNEYFGRKEQNQ